MTWEEAVEWYRQQPGSEQSIRWNYFDRDILSAAKRFSESEEFEETMRILPDGIRDVLDLGAGAGIASYAFAKRGCQVIAVEPDPSGQVGAGAIRKIASQENLPISVRQEFGETLGFGDSTFDVVYARQVLHHARDLKNLCREAARVLKPGGVLLATREHVIRDAKDLPAFLNSHPLHRHYGGEHAYTLEEYSTAISGAGLEIIRVLKPYETPVNYFPQTKQQLMKKGFEIMMRRSGFARMSSFMWKMAPDFLGKICSRKITATLDSHGYYPGNLYSFLARKA